MMMRKRRKGVPARSNDRSCQSHFNLRQKRWEKMAQGRDAATFIHTAVVFIFQRFATCTYVPPNKGLIYVRARLRARINHCVD